MGTVKLPFYARLALTLLAVVLVFFILSAASRIFIPLIFALLVSILLYPLTKFLETKLHFGRVWAALLSVILFVAAMAGFIYFLTIQIVSFSSDVPLLRKRFIEMFDSLQNWMSYKMHITSLQQSEYMDKSVNSMLENLAHSASNVLLSLTGLLLLVIFVVIFTFFMLYHRRLLKRFALHLFSPPNRDKVNEVILQTKSMINAYVQGLVVEMLLIGIVTSTMFMVMGVPYALLLGVMTALLNVIPYLGIYTAAAISMLVTFANSSGNKVLEVAIGLTIVHLLDANVLFPRIVGGRVKMNPFITIIAVIVGEFLWGIPGMFLFIPMAGIMKLVCERVVGLEAWALLIGVEDVEKPKRKVNIKE
ncbi:MAG: family transporter [Flavipsychrobacter sp.]|nr:family transporter [Flavipsychrobacter sp.]